MAMSLCLYLYLFQALKGEDLETVNKSLNSIDLSSDRMKKGKGGCETLKKVRVYKTLILFARARGYVIDCLLLMI